MASMVHYFQGCCEWRSQEIRNVKGPARSPACTTYLVNSHSLSDPFPEVTLGSLVAAQKSGMGSHTHDTIVLFDDSVSVIGFLRSWAWRREDGTGHVHKRAAGEGDRSGTEMLGSGWRLSGWCVVLVCIFPSLTWQAPLASDWWGPLPPADRSPGSLFSSSLKPVGLWTLVWAVHNIWGSWDCSEQRKYLESELTPRKPGYCSLLGAALDHLLISGEIPIYLKHHWVQHRMAIYFNCPEQDTFENEWRHHKNHAGMTGITKTVLGKAGYMVTLVR